MRQLGIILTSIVFFTSFYLANPASAPAQQSERDGEDRLETRVGSSLDIDLTQHSNFYFVDKLGVELSLQKLVQEGFLDLESYMLGHGDLISIQLQGEATGIFRGVLISPQGEISLPSIGTVSLKDLTIPQAVERLNQSVGEFFPDTEVSLILERPRLYRIHIIGDVPFPGLHYVTPQTRVDQAIYMSLFEVNPNILEGGFPVAPFRYPQDFIEQTNLSMRNIEIHRDTTYISADLHGYFKAGFKESNPMVEDGDIIHIRERQRHAPGVTLSGGIRRSQDIEYREEDKLEYLIQLAGGLTEDAVDDHLKVIRRSEEQLNEHRIAFDSDEYEHFQLEPNDRVVIPLDRQKRRNYSAWVHGEAISPGNYPISDGKTTLGKLIEMSGGMTDEALEHAAYVVRTRPAETEFGSRRSIDAQQFVRTSDQYRQGFEYLDLEQELNRNQIFVDLNDERKVNNLVLYNGDRLYIPRDDNTIFVMGQVNQPGYYDFEPGKSSSSYIAQAGGFALSAEEDRVFVIKASSNAWYRPEDTGIQSGDVLFVDRVPFDDLQASRTFEMQKRQQRNSNIQLIMAGLSTITGIITTYVAITR